MHTIYANKAETFIETTTYVNEQGTAVDVTGHTTFLYVAKYFGQDALVSIPGTLVTPLEGIVRYTLSPSYFTSMTPGAYYYTRILYNDQSVPVSVINGNFILTPAILPPVV